MEAKYFASGKVQSTINGEKDVDLLWWDAI
jgi:hypothetical protein